jgi:glycosyltransferase involved in cell wall biosynthesis
MNDNILVAASKFWPDYSGPSVRISNLYGKVYPHQQIDVVCNSVKSNTSEKFNLGQFKIVRRKRCTSLFGKLLSLVSLFIILRGLYKYKTLHIFGSSQITALVMFMNIFVQRKVILELVNTDSKPQQYLFGINVTRLQKEVTVISISPHITQGINKRHYKNVWTRPNPVSQSTFSLSRKCINSLSRTYSSQPQKPTVLSVSKFMPRKNQKFLVSVANILPHVNFLIAGPLDTEGIHAARDLGYLAECQNLIEELQLTNVSIITEFVDTAKLMQLSDVYVMPNKGEGLGTPLFEALMSGLPVVANVEEDAFKLWITKDKELGSLSHLAPNFFADLITKELRQNTIEKMEFRRSFAIQHAAEEQTLTRYRELLQ